MVAYFDTSALVPLLIEEPSSQRCRRVWDQEAVIVSSVLSYVEVNAALAQAARMARLTTAQRDRAGEAFETLWGDVARIPVRATDLRAAAELAVSHSLRGYDAVHCATALSVASGDFFAVTGDRDLLRAWRPLGVPVVDVLA